MSKLTTSEIADFHEQGFVIPEYCLPGTLVASLRQALDELMAQNPQVRPEKLVSAHIKNGNEGVNGVELFHEITRDPGILDIVEQLIGPDIIMWGCQVFCKPAGDGMFVPWHQDGQYWPIRPLATCTVWIAIDDSKIENACLRVIPGSHKEKKLFKHRSSDRDDIVLDQEVDPGEFDESQAVDVELEAGQMSLHDVYMIHGSNANQSTKRRAGLAIRYMPASSHFDREIFQAGESSAKTYKTDFSTRPIWLMRGVDACGKNEFTPS
ncbi:MAG: phytanoyl-CoA dioxygenase family protein [Lentisphaeria bacterium]|nr:phytanoyl-CoA dioxygenase family protein [Lentisphaeria bacterium]NQZ68840.1 phytanoyl-CoA dioxygenase family protein [Lentisphaeria bacterium]